MALYGIPINFTASVMHGWKFGRLMCNVFGFSLTLGGMNVFNVIEYYECFILIDL